MMEYLLKTAEGGFAAGEVFDLDTSAGVKPAQAQACSGAEETARFEEAVLALDQKLVSVQAASDEKSASIYEAERMILKDRGFTESVRKRILEEGMDAASAVDETGSLLAEKIAGSDSEYIRQRSDDIKGITDQLTAYLRGEKEHVLTTPSVILADELSPAQLSGIDPAMILGIITVKGSPLSHVSIIAGNLGVPYFYGSEEAREAARLAGRVILDEGKVVTDLDDETYLAAQSRMTEEKHRRQTEMREAVRENTDRELRTRVCANIGGPKDIPALLDSGADGVGLFRTEFLFLDRDDAPSEEEQLEAYLSVAKAMDGKETVIRTMDLGSDKRARWIRLPEEKNPALGCRGLRLSLKEENLFRTQLRALLRAAVSGNIKIMVPMVSSGWEVDAVRERLAACAQELEAEGIAYKTPPLGIMVETPAAALIADELAEKADFFSIGTNDLTQYVLALDREAQGLEDYFNPCHEAVMRLIGMTAEAAHRKNIPVCVCGELAGNSEATGKLIGLGVDSLSVSVGKVGQVKKLAIEAERTCSASDIKKADDTSIAAPADGKLIPMDEIPDPVFASGTMGDCVGILPENGNIYAPCDGVVSGIAETKHAMTFTASDGREILVHVGIDTVNLKGKGFEVLTEEGKAVRKGEQVMTADLDVIRGAGLSTMVLVCCR